MPLQALVRHLERARYFDIINERYFRLPFTQRVERCVRELAAIGAVEIIDGTVVNRDG